jgi:hypothetical protein
VKWRTPTDRQLIKVDTRGLYWDEQPARLVLSYQNFGDKWVRGGRVEMMVSFLFCLVWRLKIGSFGIFCFEGFEAFEGKAQPRDFPTVERLALICAGDNMLGAT